MATLQEVLTVVRKTTAAEHTVKLSTTTALSVVEALASHFAIRDHVEDIRSPLRTEPLALRRAEVMYVLSRFGMSQEEIARIFDKDRTTVLAAIRRVTERLGYGQDALRHLHESVMAVVGYREEIELLMEMARGVVMMTQKRETMGRERLDDERHGYTHKCEITAARQGDDPNAPSEIYKIDLYIQVGEYPDGRLAEIFLKIGKQGDIHAVYDAWARNTSLGLQHGISVEALFKACVGMSFEPAGATSNEKIPRCTSVLDYVGRWILGRYGKKEEVR